MKSLQSQFTSQFEDFETKQKSMLTLETEFEKALIQENEKFAQKMQEKREKIQSESRVEEAIYKQTNEIKRKSSLKPFQQPNISPEHKPFVMYQRQNSSRGFKKPIKPEETFENNSEKQIKTPNKLILNLIKGELSNGFKGNSDQIETFCKIIINNKSLKSKVCLNQGKTFVWNEKFDLFEDFSKAFQINFKVIEKNADKNDKLFGVGVCKLEAGNIKNQELWLDLLKEENETGKILIKLEFF